MLLGFGFGGGGKGGGGGGISEEGDPLESCFQFQKWSCSTDDVRFTYFSRSKSALNALCFSTAWTLCLLLLGCRTSIHRATVLNCGKTTIRNKMSQSFRHVPVWWLFCAIMLSCCQVSVLGSSHEFQRSQMPNLRVGEELKWERLPLVDGSSREYSILGLQERKWYEVKISYPASIPASFDISLTGVSSLNKGAGRRLLNTEKLMFFVDETFSKQGTADGLSARVMVVVHPAGVISKEHALDQPFIIYNILCEEVILGIPKQAWWVGLLAALVLFLSYSISSRLTSSLLLTKPTTSKSIKEVS